MKPIDPEGFEAMFRGNVDPWNYRSSPFEAYKRGVLLRACGLGPFGRALELGCANGETTLRLAPRCLRLTALDSSPTALKEAARRLDGLAKVTLKEARLPDGLPPGPFDLIVVSELAYYLGPNDLRLLLDRLKLRLAAGGRVVVLHHIVPFPDAAQLPALAHGEMHRRFARSMPKVFHERHARFEAVAFVRPRR